MKLKQIQLTGYGHGILSAGLFVAMAMVISASRTEITLDEILITRGIFGILFGLITFQIQKKKKSAVKRSLLPVFGRAFFGAASLACYAWNLRSGRVASSTLFSDLTPLFVLIFLLLLGRLKLSRLVIAGSALCGAALWVLHASDIQGISQTGLAVGLVGAFCGALAYLSLSKAAGKFTASEILIGLSLTLLIFGFFLRGMSTEQWSPQLSHAGWVSLISIAVISILAQLTLAWSFKHLPTHTASLLTLLATPFALVGEIISGSPIEPAYVLALLLGAIGAGLLARERMRAA